MTLQLHQPLSNLQIELFKLYAFNISEQQLCDIKLLIGNYFAEQATKSMDDFLEESKLTEQDMEKWAHEHNRVTYSA